MKLNPGMEIVLIKLINNKDGQETILFERKNSHCFFRELIKYEGYFIQLRLDWKDLDRHNEPILDADIWKEINGKKKYKRKGHWHNTIKRLDPKTGQWKYLFKFENLELQLVTIKTIRRSISAKAKIVKNK